MTSDRVHNQPPVEDARTQHDTVEAAIGHVQSAGSVGSGNTIATSSLRLALTTASASSPERAAIEMLGRDLAGGHNLLGEYGGRSVILGVYPTDLAPGCCASRPSTARSTSIPTIPIPCWPSSGDEPTRRDTRHPPVMRR